MTIPNYEITKAEAERLADELADLQKQEAKPVQALLALAAANPDFPIAPVVLHRLAQHYDAKHPATPGWARIVPPDIADGEVLRLMRAQRAPGMPVAEQAALVLQGGDPSAAVHEQQRRRAPLIAALVANKEREEARSQELQRARAWEAPSLKEFAASLWTPHNSSRSAEQIAADDALIARYRAAILAGSASVAGGAQ